jgi:phosphomannomutase
METEGLVIRGSETRRSPGEQEGTAELVRLALAFADLLRGRAEPGGGTPLRAVIGFDAFRSSWESQNSLLRGLSAGGVEVIHLGVAPSPLLLFSARALGAEGALHLAGDGRRARKSVRAYVNGAPLGAEDLLRLRRKMEESTVPAILPLRGRVRYINMIPDYLRSLEERFSGLRPLLRRFQTEVVVGANHGAAAMTVPHALLRVGCRVVKLGCALGAGEGSGHAAHDDPAMLQELGLVVRATRADLGVSLDGEGRRIAFVDGAGKPVHGGRIEALLGSPSPDGDWEGSDATVTLLRLVEALTRTRIARGRKIMFREMLAPDAPSRPPRGDPPGRGRSTKPA